MSKDIVVAIYARVSSDQQAKNNTIGSQIESLREKIEADGETLIEDMMFVDSGGKRCDPDTPTVGKVERYCIAGID